MTIPVGYRALRKALPEVLEEADNGLSAIARELIAEWADELRQLDAKIHAAQERQKLLVRDNPAAEALREIPGFGPSSAPSFSVPSETPGSSPTAARWRPGWGWCPVTLAPAARPAC